MFVFIGIVTAIKLYCVHMNFYDSVMKSFQNNLFNYELHKRCPFYPGVTQEVIDYDLLVVKLSMEDVNTIMFYINKDYVATA